jgi:hypothetical protein
MKEVKYLKERVAEFVYPSGPRPYSEPIKVIYRYNVGCFVKSVAHEKDFLPQKNMNL